ncbi:hypothetical protein [Methylobacterium soli]|uniref:Uncharacterized protein n=1 Tax=Methylobacterium soli TaxID=553447 RepID=A0A6L3STL6_9HYPH|nr:hypothetical protein [Methylobacterium soli]KAB1076945.1 hypothetical protein F6X53_21065 [Methylobacterium soli]GJE41626.1 hypothetical protein AEGHOMDF_0792 [Methylobacterium soli]
MEGPDVPPHIGRMTSLDTILQTLDALIAADDPVGLEAADRAIWDYLAGFDGLSAQSQAAADLAGALDSWPVRSSLTPTVRELVARHRNRLAEPSA